MKGAIVPSDRGSVIEAQLTDAAIRLTYGSTGVITAGLWYSLYFRHPILIKLYA